MPFDASLRFENVAAGVRDKGEDSNSEDGGMLLFSFGFEPVDNV